MLETVLTSQQQEDILLKCLSYIRLDVLVGITDWLLIDYLNTSYFSNGFSK